MVVRGRARSCVICMVVLGRAWSCAPSRPTGMILNRGRFITFYAVTSLLTGVFVVVQIQDRLERVHER